MKKITYIIVLLGLWTGANAQQEPQYSMYFFNGLVLNPAYAGSWDHAGMTAIARKQWAGLNGSPTTGNFSFHSPLGRSLHGAGLTVMQDKIGVTSQFSANAAYAFRFNVGKGRLAMGLQLGMSQYHADFTKVTRESDTDPAFAGNIFNQIMPNAGAGIYYNSRSFYMGVSVPQLIPTRYNLKNIAGQESRRYVHFLATAGFIVNLSESVKLKPSTLFKVTETGQWSIDLNASLLFQEKFWVGASYRNGDAVTGILEYVVSPKFRFGYAYDLSISKLSQFNSGSHELMIGWDFTGNGRGVSSPRYF